MEVVHEELLQEGLGSIRVRYLGDKPVLLTGYDGVQVLDIIEGRRISFFFLNS